MREIPILKILMLKELDRANPIFLICFFSVLIFIAGLILSSLRFLAFASGFVLLVYFAVGFIRIKNKFR